MTGSTAEKPSLLTAPFRALWPIVISLCIAFVLQKLITPHTNGYVQQNIFNCCFYVMLAVSLTVVNGFTGQFSIGHSGFAAVGGFAAASLLYYGSFHWLGDSGFHGGSLSWTLKPNDFRGHTLFAKGDLLFLIAVLAGGLIAAGVGWVVGLPSLRLRGDYLAIVTLGFCEITRIVIQSSPTRLELRPPDPDDVDASATYLGDQSIWKELHHLGGPVGFDGAPKYSSLFWLIAGALITVLLTIRLKYSSYGRAMISIREDEIASQSVGVNITRLKVRAFMFSAFFAGLAGGLYALRTGTISAADMGFQMSFDIVIIVVLGGLGSVSGAMISAILLTLLKEGLRDLPSGQFGLAIISGIALLVAAAVRSWVGALVTLVCYGILALITRKYGFTPSDYRLVIYSLLLIVTMILRPQGLLGLHEIWELLPARWQWWRNS